MVAVSCSLAPLTITWLPGMFLACIHMSFGEAKRSVSSSFWRLFLPTYMSAPVEDTKCMGFDAASFIFFLPPLSRFM